MRMVNHYIYSILMISLSRWNNLKKDKKKDNDIMIRVLLFILVKVQGSEATTKNPTKARKKKINI